VIVTGRLKQRSFEGRDGEKRSVMEVEVDEVGPSLRYATAKVSKNGGGGKATVGSRARGRRRVRATTGDDDPWASAPLSGSLAGNDDPPF
jgi:single-strand DNA-binding protein